MSVQYRLLSIWTVNSDNLDSYTLSGDRGRAKERGEQRRVAATNAPGELLLAPDGTQGLLSAPVLLQRVLGQVVQAPGQRAGRRVMSGKHEGVHLVLDLLVTQSFAVAVLQTHGHVHLVMSVGYSVVRHRCPANTWTYPPGYVCWLLSPSTSLSCKITQ